VTLNQMENEIKKQEKEIKKIERSEFLREIWDFNVGNYRRSSKTKRIFVFLVAAFTVFVCWQIIETRHEDKSYMARCTQKCHPLSSRIETVYLNPFSGPHGNRNVRSSKCICGSAP
jgi:hypothetical protein